MKVFLSNKYLQRHNNTIKENTVFLKKKINKWLIIKIKSLNKNLTRFFKGTSSNHILLWLLRYKRNREIL